jgi:hypothetical protein
METASERWGGIDPRGEGTGVSVRRFPYPYRAMLALCSDLDETPDRCVYETTTAYLNGTETTTMGPGLGMEVGNTIYFDMPPGQFSYWGTDDAGREMVRSLIRSGHIDCLHSFGDLATTREHAARALDELARHGCRLEVWIDHAAAPNNFGADIMYGRGDVPGSPSFHADLTYDFGIRYVWRGRVTSMIGQEAPCSVRGLFCRDHPWESTRTVAKEIVKCRLGRGGNGKYALHGTNRLLAEVSLRSGQRVWEFLRFNPHWGGVSRGETAQGLADILVEPTLSRFLDRQGVGILYTHLGKVKDPRSPLGPRTRAALGLLARYYREEKVLVTTTRRLLGYWRAMREVRLSASRREGGLRIDMDLDVPGRGKGSGALDPQGLTVYVPDPARTTVFLRGEEVAGIRRNGADHTGVPSVSIPWNRLEFPQTGTRALQGAR